MAKKSKEENRVLTQIENFYYKHARNKQISILDIGKVFNAGLAAHDAGKSVEQAVIDAIEAYCVPTAV